MNAKQKLLLCRIVFGAAMANFAVFWVLAVCLGGDAVNGAVRDGHFFLMSHGRYTEVSEAVYAYSLWHARSVWITHPLGMLAAYLQLRYDPPKK